MRNYLARGAMFLFLITVSPAVGAMESLEGRSRQAIMLTLDRTERRNRAIVRHFGSDVPLRFAL
jgi:hypothetical protein